MSDSVEFGDSVTKESEDKFLTCFGDYAEPHMESHPIDNCYKDHAQQHHNGLSEHDNRDTLGLLAEV